jgi:hypothetical protein
MINYRRRIMRHIAVTRPQKISSMNGTHLAQIRRGDNLGWEKAPRVPGTSGLPCPTIEAMNRPLHGADEHRRISRSFFRHGWLNLSSHRFTCA